MATNLTTPVLEVQGMTVSFPSRDGDRVTVLDDVSLNVWPSEVLGVVGESGSGKSMLTFATLGLTPPQGISSGMVKFEGRPLNPADSRAMSRVRGSEIGLIVQEPTPSLNPVRKIRSQLEESAKRAGIRNLTAAIDVALEEVNLRPEVASRYPGELSGGMNQRVAIAMALLQRPKLLIADEPTTALDVTTQYDVLRLLERLRVEHNMALMIISHDLGVIKAMSDRVAVMYRGRLVELGSTVDVVQTPRHPYTRQLVNSAPRLHPGDGQVSERLDEDECPLRSHDPQLDPLQPSTVSSRDRDLGHKVWCWNERHHHGELFRE